MVELPSVALGHGLAELRVLTHGVPPASPILASSTPALGSDLERFPVRLRRAIVLPTGHMVMLEAPERFVEELVAIVDETWA